MVKNSLSLQMLCCCRRSEGNCSCIALRDSLPPYVTYVPISISVPCVFTFTTSTTFNEYVDAVSGRVPWERLLPPGFPSIQISFTYYSFDTKFHPTCPGIRLWHGQISRTFDLDSDAILALTDESQKTTFWCSTCNRGIFFPNTCPFHPQCLSFFPFRLS